MTISTDEIGGKGLVVVQRVRGARASVDGILLARFPDVQAGWRVADLGCGNGLVGLMMAYDHPECTVVGVEVQAGLIRQAAEGAGLSGLKNIRFVQADLRNYPWKFNPERHERAGFDLVVANPPYREVGRGRLSPDPERAASRHELLGNAGDFAAAAAAILRRGGRSVWIYLAERRDHLLDTLQNHLLQPVRVRFVHSRAGDPPKLVLVEARKEDTQRPAVTDPPLILYAGPGHRNYTGEARKILYGE